ncbi:MAG: cell division protein FtsQ/DivIB, partial [Bdellovibrionota bacterium]
MKRFLLLVFSALALGGAGLAVHEAMHSNLFLVRVVEVSDQPENAPVDAQAIIDLAAVPTGLKGGVTLFTLDLQSVEKRLLTNPWIREVSLQKRFPQTLSISVTYRQPRAFLQGASGTLSYVDSDGTPFGRASLSLESDLPLLSVSEPAKVAGALKLVTEWEKSP